MTGTKTSNYQLQFVPEHLENDKLVPVLLDAYLNTYTSISTSDTTTYVFNVNSSVAASKATDRFRVIFNAADAIAKSSIGTLASINTSVTNVTDDKARVSVYPNPVTGNTFNLQMNNIEEGKYNVTMYNNAGVVVYTAAINQSAGSASHTIQLPANIVAGTYNLSVQSSKAVVYSTILFIKK